MSGVADLLARRRAVQQHQHALRTNDSLFESARELRRRAQPYISNGHPELAAPYLEEAELFEDAAQRGLGL